MLRHLSLAFTALESRDFDHAPRPWLPLLTPHPSHVLFTIAVADIERTVTNARRPTTVCTILFMWPIVRSLLFPVEKLKFPGMLRSFGPSLRSLRGSICSIMVSPWTPIQQNTPHRTGNTDKCMIEVPLIFEPFLTFSYANAAGLYRNSLEDRQC